MNTCETCKFWGDLQVSRSEDLHLVRLACGYTHMNHGFGMIDDSGALPEDNHMGRILTGPCFGCIHHDPK